VHLAAGGRADLGVGVDEARRGEDPQASLRAEVVAGPGQRGALEGEQEVDRHRVDAVGAQIHQDVDQFLVGLAHSGDDARAR
jgi:hypothetical protein